MQHRGAARQRDHRHRQRQRQRADRLHRHRPLRRRHDGAARRRRLRARRRRATRIGALSGPQFTATGGAAGTGHVTATSQGKSGSTGVTVTVHKLDARTGRAARRAGQARRHRGAGRALAADRLPARRRAHAAVGVRAPTCSGKARRRWAISSTSSSSPAAPPSRPSSATTPTFTWDWRPSAADWALLTTSAGGAPVTVTVDHWDAASGLQGSNPVQGRARRRRRARRHLLLGSVGRQDAAHRRQRAQPRHPQSAGEPHRCDQPLRRLPHHQPRRALPRRRAVGRRPVGRGVRPVEPERHRWATRRRRWRR